MAPEISKAAIDGDPSAYVMRGEIYQAIESFRRELSGYAKSNVELRAELNGKLDQILIGKAEDARGMGRIEEQIRSLMDTVRKQGEEIAEIRRKQEAAAIAPRDSALRFIFDVLKLLLAGAFGFFLSRFER